MTRPEQYNYIKNVSKVFGVIPAVYETLIDLTTDYAYNSIEIFNRTNADILLKFEGALTTSVLVIPSLTNSVHDRFLHNGIIQYKYVLAPTSGTFFLTSWLGGK